MIVSTTGKTRNVMSNTRVLSDKIDDLRALLMRAERERDEYREQLYGTRESLANARNAMISAGQTAIKAIETIQALTDTRERDAPVVMLANEFVAAAERNDEKTGAELAISLARAVRAWRKGLPS